MTSAGHSIQILFSMPSACLPFCGVVGFPPMYPIIQSIDLFAQTQFTNAFWPLILFAWAISLLLAGILGWLYSHQMDDLLRAHPLWIKINAASPFIIGAVLSILLTVCDGPRFIGGEPVSLWAFLCIVSIGPCLGAGVVHAVVTYVHEDNYQSQLEQLTADNTESERQWSEKFAHLEEEKTLMANHFAQEVQRLTEEKKLCRLAKQSSDELVGSYKLFEALFSGVIVDRTNRIRISKAVPARRTIDGFMDALCPTECQFETMVRAYTHFKDKLKAMKKPDAKLRVGLFRLNGKRNSRKLELVHAWNGEEGSNNSCAEGLCAANKDRFNLALPEKNSLAKAVATGQAGTIIPVPDAVEAAGDKAHPFVWFDENKESVLMRSCLGMQLHQSFGDDQFINVMIFDTDCVDFFADDKLHLTEYEILRDYCTPRIFHEDELCELAAMAQANQPKA